MNTYTKLKPLTKLAAVTAATLTATSLINCGGGGAATDNLIIRPRTLEQLVLTLNSTASYEFVRNSTSGKATDNGNQETGSILYKRLDESATYNSSTNLALEVREPKSVTSGRYTYTAINDVAGRIDIVLNGAEYGDVNWEVEPLTSRTITRSFVVSFGAGSANLASSNVTIKAQLTTVFDSNGSPSLSTNDGAISFYVDTDPADATNPAYTSPPTVANYEFFGTFTAKTIGGATPSQGYDYDPDFDNRESRISPSSLNGYRFFFDDNTTGGSIPPGATDFYLTFTRLNGGSGDIDEEGQAVHEDGTTSPPTATPGGVMYTYQRIAGTESATVELDPGLPQSGTITLFYSSNDTENQNIAGSYTTSVGGGGSFSAPSLVD